MLSSSEKYELKKKFRHLEAEICKLDTALDSKADLVDGVVPTSQLPITQDIIDALNNANAPNGINYFTTLADLSSITPGTLINVANNYAALPAANTVPGEFYWVENAQGTSWLPGPLGGTYYPNGLYYSNGTTWIFTDVPFNATQVEVDAGINNNKFLTPMTFENAAKWNTKVSSVTGPAVDNTDPLNPVITIPTNLTFYATTAASSIPGYNKLVISLDDPDYDTVAVDIPTGPITLTAQPVGQLAADAGVFAGNPGVINISTIGEIRRTSGTGTAEFYFEVYLRDSGGIETLVATSNLTPPVTDPTYGQFQASAILNNGTWTAADRVVIKFYANRVSGGSDPQYDFLFGGTNPVRTLFPISASLLLNVPIAIGVTGVTGGTAGSALTVGPTGLLSQLAFDSTPTNGSVNPVTSDGVYDALQLKQDNVTLTTTGTSGAATLVGSTLNIPQYQSVLTNPVTGTGTAGQVAYFSGTSAVTGSANLFWDAVNSRLGVGTLTPTEKLHVFGNLRFDTQLRDNRGNSIIVQSDNIFVQNRTLTIANGSYKEVAIASSNLLVGNTDGTGRLTVRGSGTTSATTALLVQNSTPTELFKVRDNGAWNFNGDGIVKGSGNTSATTALSVLNTDNSILFDVRNDARVRIGLISLYPTLDKGNTVNAGAGGLFIGYASGALYVDIPSVTLGKQKSLALIPTAGSMIMVSMLGNFAPTSGNATFFNTVIEPTINQTGGANGITRGLHVNPTLTSAADWRSIEFSNNTGWGIYGAGSANNYLGGRLALNSTSLTNVTLRNSIAISGGTSSFGYFSDGIIQSGVTSTASYFHISPQTQNASFTLTNLNGYYVENPTIGASSAVTNVYGFYGNIASGTGRWNLYMNGTAANYIAGNTSIGTTTSAQRLRVLDTSQVISATFGGGAAAPSWVAIGTVSSGSTPFIQGYNNAISATSKLALNPSGSDVTIGTTSNSARLTVQGSGTTSATKAFVVNNATPTALLEILDNGRINQTIPGAASNTLFGTSAGASASLTGSNNSFFGVNTGQNNTTGVNNSFFGQGAGGSNTTGGSNSFFGQNVGGGNTTGGNNSFFGGNAGIYNTTGGSNSFFGLNAGYNNTTGGNNSFFGVNAGFNNTTGASNSFFGGGAGRYIADGTTSLTVANNSVFIGNETRANANSETNQIVIGHQAIGNGSNTATLGNTSITATYLRGSISVDAPTIDASAKLQVDSTTKGVLLPRMTEAEKNAISTPATGLLIYQTDATAGFYFYNGAAWKALAIIA